MSQDSKSMKVLEGEINIPYKWTTGPVVGKFLTALRDEKKLLGIKCSRCGRVSTPPEEICGRCKVRNTEMVEVEQEGTVEAYTIVNVPVFWQPQEPPFVIGFVKLDGSDTLFIHRLLCKPDDAKAGARVRIVWNEERKGTILDIKGFELI